MINHMRMASIIALAGLGALSGPSIEIPTRRVDKMPKLHGTGKKYNNAPGTKKNRALRRIKGR